MREVIYLLAAVAGFLIVGTIDADIQQAMHEEHAPAAIAHLED